MRVLINWSDGYLGALVSYRHCFDVAGPLDSGKHNSRLFRSVPASTPAGV